MAHLLAVAAGELLTDMLDHLPLPRDHLQRLGDVLAQFAQPRAAAAQANGRSGLDHPIARQMLGEGLTRRAFAGKATTFAVLAMARSAAISSSVAASSSRTPVLSARVAVHCVPSAGHRADASASRSAIADKQSRLYRRRPWPWPPPVLPRSELPWRFLDALCALCDQSRLQRGDVGREVLGRRHEPDYPTSPKPERYSTIR